MTRVDPVTLSSSPLMRAFTNTCARVTTIALSACGPTKHCILAAIECRWHCLRLPFSELYLGGEATLSSQLPCAETAVCAQEHPCSSQKVIAVACGGWHTAFIGEKGGVWTCGRGEYGRLGLGDEKSQVGTVVGALLRVLSGIVGAIGRVCVLFGSVTVTLAEVLEEGVVRLESVERAIGPGFLPWQSTSCCNCVYPQY